jgi:predicted GIY-YIG superfamily endonuclease
MVELTTNKNYIVYKHTTPSNKVYIGITGRTAERRWQGRKKL